MNKSNRQVIEALRVRLKEVSADTFYTNQFLYKTLIDQATWLIKREISAGRIYKSTNLFQTLRCQNVIEQSAIDSCCPIKTRCKMYRLECPLPDTWFDNDGPVIKTVTSIDNSTEFFVTTPTAFANKEKDPYQNKNLELYTFFSDGYFWFPKVNPHKVNILGFYQSDISHLNGCSPTTDCTPFLDREFFIPNWLMAECIVKAFQEIAPTIGIPSDSNINKNPNIRM